MKAPTLQTCSFLQHMLEVEVIFDSEHPNHHTRGPQHNEFVAYALNPHVIQQNFLVNLPLASARQIPKSEQL